MAIVGAFPVLKPTAKTADAVTVPMDCMTTPAFQGSTEPVSLAPSP
jgi:hypothetical protein